MNKSIIVILFLLHSIIIAQDLQKDISVHLGINSRFLFEPEAGIELKTFFNNYISLSYKLDYSFYKEVLNNKLSHIYKSNDNYYEENRRGEISHNNFYFKVIPNIHFKKYFFIGYGLGIRASTENYNITSTRKNIITNTIRTDTTKGYLGWSFDQLIGILNFGLNFKKYSIWINASQDDDAKVGINISYNLFRKMANKSLEH